MSKIKKLALIYTVAALVILSVYTAVNYKYLESYRTAAGYSADRGLEEAMYSVGELSKTLSESVYATDSSMCSLLCTRMCSQAYAAIGAMSSLPFSTLQLENTNALLNTVGDYAEYLSANCENGFDGESIENLTALAEELSKMQSVLSQLHSDLDEQLIAMDSTQTRARNVNDAETERVSERFAAFEQDSKPVGLSYDGKYGASDERTQIKVDADKASQLVNTLFGNEDAMISGEYADGRLGINSGDYYCCVSDTGIETVGCSRCVYETKLSLAECEEKAEEYLKTLGCEQLRLYSEGAESCVANFVYVSDSGVLSDCGRVKISVNMDDGSLRSASIPCEKDSSSEAEFTVSEDEARIKVPESLTVNYCTKALKNSAGGISYPCYVFNCTDRNGGTVQIWVDANTGKQRNIEIG